MSVVRGRPPGLAGGIRGSSRAYCSSLRACPAPKSPTRARLSAVHMACLQEGLLPSRTGRRPACATTARLCHPLIPAAQASQTASQLSLDLALQETRRPVVAASHAQLALTLLRYASEAPEVRSALAEGRDDPIGARLFANLAVAENLASSFGLGSREAAQDAIVKSDAL